MNSIKKSLLFSAAILSVMSSATGFASTRPENVKPEEFSPAMITHEYPYVNTDASVSPYNNAVLIGLPNWYRGSGGFISNNVIVTNAHVVLNNEYQYYDNLSVHLKHNSKLEYPTGPSQANKIMPSKVFAYDLEQYKADQAESKGHNSSTDIAFIVLPEPVSIEYPDIEIINVADSDSLQVGDEIRTTGYPAFGEYPELEATHGFVRGKQFTTLAPVRSFDAARNVLSTKADVVGGSSGSPIVSTSTNRIIGVMASAVPRYNSEGVEHDAKVANASGAYFNAAKLAKINQIIKENTPVGFYEKAGRTYYFDRQTTKMQRGLKTLTNDEQGRQAGLYYFEPATGVMVKGESRVVDSVRVDFDENGRATLKPATVNMRLMVDGKIMDTKTEQVQMNELKTTYDVSGSIPKTIEKEGKVYNVKTRTDAGKGTAVSGQNVTIQVSYELAPAGEVTYRTVLDDGTEVGVEKRGDLTQGETHTQPVKAMLIRDGKKYVLRETDAVKSNGVTHNVTTQPQTFDVIYDLAPAGAVTIKLVDEKGAILDEIKVENVAQGDKFNETAPKTIEKDGKKYELVDSEKVDGTVTDQDQAVEVKYKEVEEPKEEKPKEDETKKEDSNTNKEDSNTNKEDSNTDNNKDGKTSKEDETNKDGETPKEDGNTDTNKDGETPKEDGSTDTNKDSDTSKEDSNTDENSETNKDGETSKENDNTNKENGNTDGNGDTNVDGETNKENGNTDGNSDTNVDGNNSKDDNANGNSDTNVNGDTNVDDNNSNGGNTNGNSNGSNNGNTGGSNNNSNSGNTNGNDSNSNSGNSNSNGNTNDSVSIDGTNNSNGNTSGGTNVNGNSSSQGQTGGNNTTRLNNVQRSNGNTTGTTNTNTTNSKSTTALPRTGVTTSFLGTIMGLISLAGASTLRRKK